MNFKAIAETILENNYIAGVRTTCEDESYVAGDGCRESYDWDVENDCSTYHTTGETTEGTCATHIDTNYFATDDYVSELAERIAKIVELNKVYGNETQIIIVGNSVNNDGMFDEGEVRIINAEVIAVL